MAKETKEMVAVRLDPADRRRLKAIAKRLGVSESDFLRYSIKTALEDFAPLTDQAKEGQELLAAFVDHPDEKSRWLGLDRAKLDEILHGDLENEHLRVDAEDLEVLLRGPGGKGFHEWQMAIAKGEKQVPFSVYGPATYLKDKYVENLRALEYIEREQEEERRKKL
jgi:predicted DNA-binding protein